MPALPSTHGSQLVLLQAVTNVVTAAQAPAPPGDKVVHTVLGMAAGVGQVGSTVLSKPVATSGVLQFALHSATAQVHVMESAPLGDPVRLREYQQTLGTVVMPH